MEEDKFKLPEDLEKKFMELIDLNQFTEPIEKSSFPDFLGKIVNAIGESLVEVNNLEFWIDISEYIINNEEFLCETTIFDKEIYDDLNIFHNYLNSKDPLVTQQISVAYFKSLKNKMSESDVINSLLITKDFISESEDLILNKPMEIYFNDAEALYMTMLKNYNENEFKERMFDIILKYSYLIEAYFKEILIFILNGYSIDDPSIQDWIDLKKKKNMLTIGVILHKLNKVDEGYDNQLVKFRNSIAHANFVMNYSEKKLEFYDRNWREERNFVDFITSFYYLTVIIRTFNYFISKKYYLKDFFSLLRIELKKFKEEINNNERE